MYSVHLAHNWTGGCWRNEISCSLVKVKVAACDVMITTSPTGPFTAGFISGTVHVNVVPQTRDILKQESRMPSGSLRSCVYIFWTKGLMKNVHRLSEVQVRHLDMHWSYFRKWPHKHSCHFPAESSTVELGQDAFLPSITIFSVHLSRCCSSVGLTDTFRGSLSQETQSDERRKRIQDAPYI